MYAKTPICEEGGAIRKQSFLWTQDITAALWCLLSARFPCVLIETPFHLQAHVQHIAAYGVGNAKRWTGLAQSQPSGSLLDFTIGMESRKASISIPHSVLLQKRGW